MSFSSLRELRFVALAVLGLFSTLSASAQVLAVPTLDWSRTIENTGSGETIYDGPGNLRGYTVGMGEESFGFVHAVYLMGHFFEFPTHFPVTCWGLSEHRWDYIGPSPKTKTYTHDERFEATATADAWLEVVSFDPDMVSFIDSHAEAAGPTIGSLSEAEINQAFFGSGVFSPEPDAAPHSDGDSGVIPGSENLRVVAAASYGKFDFSYLGFTEETSVGMGLQVMGTLQSTIRELVFGP